MQLATTFAISSSVASLNAGSSNSARAAPPTASPAGTSGSGDSFDAPTCVAGTCSNIAWVTPSTRVCTSCHDDASTAGHAAINTWTDSSGNVIETYETCHGSDADFAVDKVHNVANPYVPPYPREKQ